MDGHFVPNMTLGPPVVAAIGRVARAPLDVHLMITNPRDYAEAYAKAGAHVLTFHIEVTKDAADALSMVEAFREAGVPRVGSPSIPIRRSSASKRSWITSTWCS